MTTSAPPPPQRAAADRERSAAPRPLPPRPNTAALQIWEPFRARDGSVYFALRGGRGTSTWEAPEAVPGRVAVAGDGTTAVNDPEAWRCYVDSGKASGGKKYYFVNTISGERSWRVPPGCQNLPAVNVPDAWLTFLCAERDNARYYFNKVTKERTWHRPKCLGEAQPEDPGHDVSVAAKDGAALEQKAPPARFTDDDGHEYVAGPGANMCDDDLEDLDDLDELDELIAAGVPAAEDGQQAPDMAEQEFQAAAAAEQNVVGRDARPPEHAPLAPISQDRLNAPVKDEFVHSATIDPAEAAVAAAEVGESALREENETEARLVRLRDAYEAENKLKIRARFEELLDERGVLPHSNWVNWAGRLEGERRMQDVPIEDRANWFRQFCLGLIGRVYGARVRRAKRFRAALREFSSYSPAAAALIKETAGDPGAFETALSTARADNDLAELAVPLQSLFAGLFCTKDRALALRGALPP